MDTRAFVDKYLNETSEICARTERDEVARFIQILFDAWRARRQVFTMGNGGSASTATLPMSGPCKPAILAASSKT